MDFQSTSASCDSISTFQYFHSICLCCSVFSTYCVLVLCIDWCYFTSVKFLYSNYTDVLLFYELQTLSVPSVPKSSSFGTLRLPGKKWKTGSTKETSEMKSDKLKSVESGSHISKMSGMITAPR